MGILMRHLIAFILLFSISANAATIYVAQSTAGGDTGADCANAHSMAWLNTSGNWGGGGSDVMPGDTVRICGTITTAFVVPASGSMGSPVTIALEPGASFSKGTWNSGGANGDAAIYANGKSYLTFQGNRSIAAPDIESTSNGTGLTTANQSVGMWFDSCNNIIVERMAITNMYRRTPNSLDNIDYGGCIQFRTTSHHITIRSNIVSEANVPILVTGEGTTYIYGNIGSRAGEGVIVIGPPAATTMDDVLIYDNYVTQDPSWSGQPAIHLNCMHLFAFGTGGSENEITNLKVYGNTFGGPMGTDATSMLFLEGRVLSPLVYNNLFIPGSQIYGGNGYLTLKGAINALVANNTFIGAGPEPWVGTAIGTTEYGAAMDSGHTITNNLIQNIATMIADAAGSLEASDYNRFYPDSGSAFTGFRTFAQWKVFCGCDANSAIGEADLTAGYVPTVDDTVAKGQGVNLSGVFTTDHNGNTRTVPWDVGAFEFIPASLPSATVSGNLNVGGNAISNFAP